MNKLIIYFFISKYKLYNIIFNFITDNFIEIIKISIDFMAAAATVGAFLYTFKNIRNNSIKEKNDQIIKNKKTIYLIDLITEKYREDISEIINKIYEIRYSNKMQVNFDNTDFKYQIIFEDIKPPFPGIETIETEFEDVYIIIETYKYLNDPFIQETLENYIKEIKQNLSNQHQNLDLNSLEKINEKLKTLNKLIKNIKMFDVKLITMVSQSKLETSTLGQKPKKTRKKVNEEWLNKVIKNQKEEIKLLINELKKAMDNLEQ
ncbi:hypothetical protein SAP2_25400 (plasmid) [Staphylococcus arlettae]|uniref:hypothetical protein n=1 Tax=Staphylococcus arlettae TaxID=29378 RepID=UPI00113EC562|nr:hypothetical protein [Staphylococcus arlettae]BBK29356.1 hypothetical protein SAP2_25400 [Staphylococcus arlettae]